MAAWLHGSIWDGSVSYGGSIDSRVFKSLIISNDIVNEDSIFVVYCECN